MKTIKSAVKPRLASVGMLTLVSLLAPLSSMAQGPVGNAPLVNIKGGVPQVVNPSENEFQRQSHFLSFVGSYIPESADSARAYYNAIDPGNTKKTFADWLKNAGFIGQTTDWNQFGPQKFACDLPGCNYPKLNLDGTPKYGPNIINTDSHVIVLNAADLGFVRNQFIRCVDPANPKSTSPCSASNPKIYTYLENYPVNPFAAGSGGSNFGATSLASPSTGYPFKSEVDAAINSAIERPVGQFKNSAKTDRIADVAFEWAPPATNPTSSTRFGQLYAYIFVHDNRLVTTLNPLGIVETTDFPAIFDGTSIIDFKAGNGTPTTIKVPPPPGLADKFAPNLDGVGFKQHPGVCLVCHGGAPTNLTSTGAYPRQGNINGFRFLPLDNANLLFPSAAFTPDPILTQGFTLDFTQSAQEAQIKAYNLAVLRTVPVYKESDGTGAVRVPHLREIITGWYSTGGNYSDDTSMSGSTQKANWVPKGWREVQNGGTAPLGAEQLYREVVGPSCRSCHFTRELSLDFGTYANFHQESDLQQLTLLAQCKQDHNADPKAKFMPLALLTFVRFWETQTGTHTLSDSTALTNEVDRLARDFGFSSVNGYCGTNP